MSHHKRRVPSYCHHKSSGRAVVRLNGKDHYLGAYGSPESHAEYQRLIDRWLATNGARAVTKAEQKRLVDPMATVSTVLLQYREFAESYYIKNAKPTKELTEMRLALRPVRLLFGDTIAADFGPLKLKAVRNHMIEMMDLSRGVINNRVNRIKRFFRWAVAEELVPPSVIQGLQSVPGLKRGRTTARETDPVKPADDQYVDAVLPHVAPQVSAMIQLQRLSGMRPGEVVLFRASEIDTRGEIWIYEPCEHKNEWRDHDRKIALGPKAQEILKPFLKLKTDAFIFSPKDAEEHRNGQRRAARKSPMTPSQRKRQRKRKPKRTKRDRYDTASYRRAITYGIKLANRQREKEKLELIPHWCPLQLRHSRATELNELYGIEAAAVSLGHAHADVTKVYAERNLKLAIDVAKKTG